MVKYLDFRTIAVACAIATAACDDDTATTTPPPAAGELVTVEPGGDTICSRGTPYRFFAIGGDPKRLVLDFQGGGACWNALTCSIEDAIFAAAAPTTEQFANLRTAADLGGLYKDDAANPLQGWSLVHIPYCTGDVHWGRATKVYSEDLTIEHRGLDNVEAVLSWAKARYPAPDTIFVTGCSAGAYGAIGHATRIARTWPKAQIRVLADSGAGIITDSFYQASFPNWNAGEALPLDLPALNGKGLLELTIVDLYLAVAATFPNMRIGQYNTAYDRDQSFYYSAMGGTDPWSTRMRETVTAIAAAAPNFRHYLAPGPVHCIHPYRIFYERGADGPELDYATWLDEFINAETPPDSVVCSPEGCLSDPVCDACKTSNTSDLVCRWCEEWNDER